MALSFLAGIVYNPLENYWSSEPKNNTIRFERPSYEEGNRIRTYINMLYTLSYGSESSTCYFDAPLIIGMMPNGNKYANLKYWRKGILAILRAYYLPLINNAELIKKYPEIQASYDFIKTGDLDLTSSPSRQQRYFQSAEQLKTLQRKLTANRTSIPASFFTGLKSIKKELHFLTEKLTNKVAGIEQAEVQVLLNPDAMDDVIYEAKGAFWAMLSMIIGTTGEVVVYLNDQELMDAVNDVNSQLYSMYYRDHSHIHQGKNYHINTQHKKEYMDAATKAMKQQLLDIDHLLDLIAIVECDNLCQMRKRNGIKVN